MGGCRVCVGTKNGVSHILYIIKTGLLRVGFGIAGADIITQARGFLSYI